jgi:guanylate kinase
MIFVVSGPSGCGKSTLIGRVLKELGNLRFSVSHTTRPKREGEIDGQAYHFVTQTKFEEMIQAGEFIEWARVHGYYYGTSRAEIAKVGAAGDIILDIDVQGARQIRENLRNVTFIFVMPPVLEELRRRLEARKTETPASIARRLADARGEIAAYREFVYVVINKDLEKAVGELRAILSAARCRTDVREGEIRAIVQSFNGEEGRG